MNATVQEDVSTNVATADALRAIVLKVLKLAVPASALTETTNLYELGLESLNVVELLTDIEAEFDIVIDVEDLHAELFATLGNLAAFVESKRDEPR